MPARERAASIRRAGGRKRGRLGHGVSFKSGWTVPDIESDACGNIAGEEDSRPLATALVLLFGFQGEHILAQPIVIALLAVPILIQVYLNAGLAYLLNRIVGEQHCVAGPSALIGASIFFELAVAAAISLFGFNSGPRSRRWSAS